jgi:ABC-type nitrate/sulfonate/bicarbonate transport system substrate-binding protein
VPRNEQPYTPDLPAEGDAFTSALTRRALLARGAKATGVLVAGPGVFAALSNAARAEPTVTSALAPRIPETTVKIGIAQYIDVSWQIIGATQGWFKEAGITLKAEPAGTIYNIAGQWGSTLINHNVDVQVGSYTHWITGFAKAPFLRQLAWSDLFQGFALDVRPQLHLKTYGQFVAAGNPPERAIKLAVQQLKGLRLLTSPDSAIKAFVNLALSKADMTLSDVKATELPDAQHIPLMLTGRADVSITGVPPRLNLESKGMIPILSAGELAQGAKPSADSEELQSVFRDGWTTTNDWFEKNHDTALRMNSVMYRIIHLIKTDPKKAASLQLPFLNSGLGNNLKISDILNTYKNLDPFFEFSEQAPWYTDKDSPLYWEYEVQSYINLWTKKGLFKPGQFTAKDMVLTPQIYAELDRYRRLSANLIKVAEQKVRPGTEPAKVLAQAKQFYAHFNYLDAYRFAQAAKAKA